MEKTEDKCAVEDEGERVIWAQHDRRLGVVCVDKACGREVAQGRDPHAPRGFMR